MTNRKGAGRGTGKGYKNLRSFPRDASIHSQSAKGMKQPQKIQNLRNKPTSKGLKSFYQMDNIGKAKYTISKHDGVSKCDDGSAFFDLAIFKNKKDLANYKSDLFKKGYIEKPFLHI